MFNIFRFFKKQAPENDVREEALAPYINAIQGSMRPCIRITSHESDGLDLWNSKFCGRPYLPKGKECPKNSAGEYLHLLAQLNFEEIPALEGFPDKGLLQFWIAQDDVHGCDFEDNLNQDGFRVVYYPEIQKDNLVTDFSFLPDWEFSPFEDTSIEYSLSFEASDMPVTLADYRFEKIYKDLPEESKDEFNDAYCNKYGEEYHQIGGYPTFTQTDPREYNKDLRGYHITLLQIISDDYMGWGDLGVANFLIKEEDLRKKDFSKVSYNWDCF